MGRGGGYQHQYYGCGSDGGMWMDQSQAQSWGSPPMKPPPLPPPPPPPPSSAFYGGGGGDGFGMHHQSSEDDAYGSSGRRHQYGYTGAVPVRLNKFNAGGYNGYAEEVGEHDKSSYMEQSYGGGMMKQEEYENEMRMRMEYHSHGFNPYHHNYNNNVPSKPQYPHFQQSYWAPKGV